MWAADSVPSGRLHVKVCLEGSYSERETGLPSVAESLSDCQGPGWAVPRPRAQSCQGLPHRGVSSFVRGVICCFPRGLSWELSSGASAKLGGGLYRIPAFT